MTTPRVTVPVEDLLFYKLKYLILEQSEGEWTDEMIVRDAHHFANHIRPLLSAAPAPEGGAVETAVKIATDLHHAYEQLIYGLPKYLEAENLTDEENMIREAWITLDVTAHRLAALATREEAPAEAVTLEARPEREDYLNPALRAQPLAREDAQPVWVDGVPTKHHAKEWFIAETTFGGRVVLTALPEEYTYDFKTADETYIKADRIKRWMPFPDSQYLFPHPAPDALRDALADLASWFTKPVQGQNGMVWVIPAGEQGADDAINAALAALQAEQKGGA